jgi:hypothetical protein
MLIFGKILLYTTNTVIANEVKQSSGKLQKRLLHFVRNDVLLSFNFVIASAARQSARKCRLDCFTSFAMTAFFAFSKA